MMINEAAKRLEDGGIIYFPLELPSTAVDDLFVIDPLPGESKRKARRRHGMVKGKSK